MRGWGSGQPADLGSLEVESFTSGAGGASSKGDSTARAGGAKPAREPLFHEQLARRLAQLEVRLPGRARTGLVLRQQGRYAESLTVGRTADTRWELQGHVREQPACI